MAQDKFTEVTRRSWGQRVGGSFKGIVFGLVLVAISVWILFGNEGRAVRRAKALEEGGGIVVSVAPQMIQQGNEGSLVHVSGLATTDETLRDPEFGIAVKALQLARTVEMYQWQEKASSETKKKLGGSTETTTTYSYEKGWSDRAVDSSRFKQPGGHANPGAMPFAARSVVAATVTLGAFRLSPSLVGRITAYQPLTPRSVDALPAQLRWKSRLVDGGVFIGRNPTAPEVGDLRVSFRMVPPTTVSIVARQSGDTLEPYRTTNGGTIELLRTGVVPAETMFQKAQESNRMLTWALRGLGFLLMAFGLRTVLRPLSVLLDVIPFLGNLAGKATGLIAFGLAACFSLIVIAVAWLYYRPMVALLAVAGAAAALVLALAAARRARGVTPPVPASAPPPPPPGG